MSIYDVTGRMISELVNENMEQGVYNVTWDAANQATGIYFIRMVAGGSVYNQKLMLIK